MTCEFNIDELGHTFCNLSVVGRIMIPKDVCVLIPKACEYVTLHNRNNFADVIKIKGFNMGRLFWAIQMGPV